MLTREMTEDVSIQVARPVEKTMILKKGALMVVEMIAVRASSIYPAMLPPYPDTLG
jgi:hypothetical protein